MYELPSEEFLYLLYLKISILLKRNIEIELKEKKTFKEKKEYVYNRTIIINVFEYLLNLTNNNKLKNTYLKIIQDLTLNKYKDLLKEINLILNKSD
jgi:hypothetical protein